ncbi:MULTISPECIES: DUF305 domain-containing protein [Moraxella]|uniref:Putative exported protein n=1 Tax=Moraxella catarrhalis TaxID=480 RepID=A0A7Z0UZ27_MORCA|nr:DUF305 domain-containing protein [Moraxella catarrhalis]OAV01152.1 putative exported protein [Moraxella catarrhalis]STY81578.1 Uncharacterized protein conserved in bacteria [Moraxella catarrhalis]
MINQRSKCKQTVIKAVQYLFISSVMAGGLAGCSQTDESSGAIKQPQPTKFSDDYHQSYVQIIQELGQTIQNQSLSTDINHQFVSTMLNHQQAVVMMAYVQLKFGSDEQALNIAQRSIDIQQAQMAWMRQWLANDALTHERTEQSPHLAFNGYESYYTQTLITAANSQTADKAFIHLMQMHQLQAIHMAEQALEMGLDAEVAVLAEDIIITQTTELKALQNWLHDAD